MKIAIDVMGGDFAPQELVAGAKSYLQENGEAGLILVGDEKIIRELWSDLPENCEIYHTTEVVEMGEHPLHALRQKKMVICHKLIDKELHLKSKCLNDNLDLFSQELVLETYSQ